MVILLVWVLSRHLLILAHEDPFTGVSEAEEDSAALLNEILGGLSVDEGDFSQAWTEVFGTGEQLNTAPGKAPESSQRGENSFFLPSQLLDQSLNNLQSPLAGQDISVLCEKTWNRMAIKSFLVVKTIHICEFEWEHLKVFC